MPNSTSVICNVKSPTHAKSLSASSSLALSVAVPVFLVTCPGDLEAQIEAFVTDYNHLRYHESIANLTPADVYFARGQTILIERERIKRQTIANRRLAAPSESRITLQTRRARDSLNLSRSLSQKL
jgi:putative transposase